MNFERMTINEINNFVEGFNEIEKIEIDIIKKLSADHRKGVKKIAQKIMRAKKKKKAQKDNWHKQNEIIYQLQKNGFQMIAGIDEAGRGPLAGPVVSSAVILDLNKPILGLTDSKKLSSTAREKLFKIIFEKARVGIGIVSNTIIDRLNIHQATFLAMRRAVEDLQLSPGFLLIDGGYTIPDIDYKQRAIVGGDLKVNAISAASIIAKVTRDRIMDELHSSYPSYNFLSNKGYGTQEHIEAIKDIGPCPLHRFSYKIVKENKEK